MEDDLNTQFALTGLNPFDDPLDRILAEIALSIQLPPSLHDKAKARYEAVRRHLEGQDAFRDQIEHFYPQGSMAIDATISTRGTDDEYDLDIVSQLGGRFRLMEPLEILIELEAALVDYPVQRVLRQTRCVTLFYADKMHLDVTPALRIYGTLDRESHITHAKGPHRSADDRLVDMNAYGFAEWYASMTPLELRMAKEFHRRWRDQAGFAFRADADVDDVPDQCDFVVKNTATLALQLIKRFRNVRYATYSGRIPPSVMLSYYAAVAAQPNTSLSAMVVRLANWIIHEIEYASLYGKKLHVANPVCPDDVFTDRWPKSIAQQNEFAGHLRELVHALEAMRKGEMLPNDMMGELRENFGDRVVTRAADQIAAQVGTGIQQSRQLYTRRGGVLWPAAAAASVSPVINPAVSAAKPHTFFGRKI
jgi:Second Messenger Oligonucleotide or Dinucleotide Synthetase domain